MTRPGRKLTPEHREKLRQAALKRFADPAEREKLSAAVSRPNVLGKRISRATGLPLHVIARGSSSAVGLATTAVGAGLDRAGAGAARLRWGTCSRYVRRVAVDVGVPACAWR